jgi:peptidoglycan/LPS O-acetylase OafA/YrhL
MVAPANSFHLLRLVAATLVIVSHGYVLTGHGGDPMWRWFGTTAGFIGVAMFFTMSG